MKKRIHIFGASGSGTTTIAKRICNKINYRHFDSDDYFWLPTANRYTEQRPQEERLKLIENDLKGAEEWVLSGSVAGWADEVVSLFDLVIFVYIPQEIRLERLKKREYERYGDEVLPGGSRYEQSKEFLDWALLYDSGTATIGRTLERHEKWLQGVKCDVLRIVNHSLEDSINEAIKVITK